MVASSAVSESIAPETAPETPIKLVCGQGDLSLHLASVGRAVASRPSLPVLANVLLEADGETGRVALTAFDLNLGIRSEFEAQVITGGATTLPAKLLNDIVSKLPKGELTLEQPDPTGPMTLTWGSNQYQVRGLSAEEFPALPEIRGQERVEMQVDTLLKGIEQTIFAASHDETKQVLTGVHVQLLMEDEPLLEFAATDGHRLATVKLPLIPSSDQESAPASQGQTPSSLQFTIPVRTLKELERILSNQSATTVSVQFDSSQVQFGLERHLITSRLLDGQYPDYNRLIPAQFERLMTVDRKQLIESLERIAVLAAQKNDIIKFRLSEGEQSLGISVEAPDVGSGEESLPVQMSGGDLEIAFNVKYLLDALKVINTQDVQLHLNGATQPVVWQPVGAMQLRYLVMPVQIRGN